MNGEMVVVKVVIPESTDFVCFVFPCQTYPFF